MRGESVSSQETPSGFCCNAARCSSLILIMAAFYMAAGDLSRAFQPVMSSRHSRTAVSNQATARASTEASPQRNFHRPGITNQGRRHRAFVFRAEIGVLQHLHRRAEAELVLRCHPSQGFRIPRQIRRHDFLNGQGCRSEGSTDVLSSYLRYAGGLTCPVVMKGYPE